MHLNIYDDLCTRFHSTSPTLFVVATASILHAITLWSFCAWFLFLDRLPSCKKYKLPRTRPDLNPKLLKNVQLNASAVFEQLVGTVVVVPLGVWVLCPVLRWRGVHVCDTSVSVPSACVHLLGMVIGCDTMFYWVHRLLHDNKWLYRTVHKQHHEFKGTTVWASEYFGVIDMVLNILPGVLPAVVMGSHFSVLLVFTALRQWQTVQSHAGYNLPWYLDFCNVFDGARRHDFHHSHNVGCYGDWFGFWDWLCGTDVPFNKYLKKIGVSTRTSSYTKVVD